MGTEDDNNKSSSASDLMQLEQQQNHHHPAASCFFTVPSSTGLTSSSTSVAMGTTANLAWKKATSLQPTKKLVIKPFKGGPKHKKHPPLKSQSKFQTLNLLFYYFLTGSSQNK